MVLWLVVARYLHIWWCIMVTRSCPVHIVAYSVLKVFRWWKLVVDMVPSIGSHVNYHTQYFVFGNGTFVINLHALFSFFLYKCYLSTVSRCLPLWIVNIMSKRPPYGPGSGRGSLRVGHKPSCCHICRLGHVFEPSLEFFFLSVRCKQGGNHGTEVGIHHCLCIWGVYLYMRFYVRSFRCCFWFYSPT